MVVKAGEIARGYRGPASNDEELVRVWFDSKAASGSCHDANLWFVVAGTRLSAFLCGLVTIFLPTFLCHRFGNFRSHYRSRPANLALVKANHKVPNLLTPKLWLSQAFRAATGCFATLSFMICAASLPSAQNVSGCHQTGASIPLAELGAEAGSQYQGDGLSVLPAAEGARLRCVFQKLEGEATAEGLWLASTTDGAKADRFRVLATSVGREDLYPEVTQETRTSISDFWFLVSDFESWLPSTGTVAVVEKLVHFNRPGLVEEYSVSVDGIQQDLLVLQRPSGEGKLRVELDVAGAKAGALVNGA